MNRIQFWITTALSGVIVLLLIAHILLVRQNNVYQAMIAQGQQVINQGQTSKAMVEELAKRIFSDSQKNGGDQGLKDLMARQQITFSPTTPSSDSTSTSSPAPDATPAAH